MYTSRLFLSNLASALHKLLSGPSRPQTPFGEKNKLPQTVKRKPNTLLTWTIQKKIYEAFYNSDWVLGYKELIFFSLHA